MTSSESVTKLTWLVIAALLFTGCKTFTNINLMSGNSTVSVERSYESTYAPQDGGGINAESNSTE